MKTVGGKSRTTYQKIKKVGSSKKLTLKEMEKAYELFNSLGFNYIYSDGKEIKLKPFISDGTDIAYFQHIFLSGYPNLGTREIPQGKHACLKFGYWCWKNALVNPKMALNFLIWKYANNSSR